MDRRELPGTGYGEWNEVFGGGKRSI